MGDLLAPGPLGTPALLGGEIIAGDLLAPGPLGTPALIGMESTLAAPGPLGTPALLGNEILAGAVLAPGPLGAPALAGLELIFSDLAAPGPLGAPAIRGWVDFAAVIGDIETYYVLDVSGDTPLRIPISSWQCTLSSTVQSYLQAVIPAAEDWALDLLARRDAGESFTISRGAHLPSGEIFEYAMATAPMEQVRLDRGPQRFTCTLIGYYDPVTAEVPATRALSHIMMASTNGTSARLRAAIDWQLQPGDTATGAGQSFVVRYVSYYVGEQGAYMDCGS